MTSETAVGRSGVPVAVVAVVTVVLTATTVAVEVLSTPVLVPPESAFEPGWVGMVTGLVQVVPGALLLHRMPRHPVAWVLVVSGLLWLLGGLAASWATYAIYVAPGTAGASAAFWFSGRLGSIVVLGLPLVLLVFPDGRLPSGRVWRPLSVVSLGTTALFPLALTFAPADVLQQYDGEILPPELAALALDPVSIELPAGGWDVLLGLVFPFAVLSLVVPFAAVVNRYRSAGGERRQQLRWLLWAGLVDMLLVLLLWVVPAPLPTALLVSAVAITSAAIVVAVTRYRLYAIDGLLSATVVYGLLAVSVVAVDVAVFAVAGAVLSERGAALAAIAVVAVLYAPLRDRLWRAARRVVLGSRDDPYGTVATLAERLELAAGSDEQLRAVARSVADAFRLPYVRVQIERPDGAQVHVEHGQPTGPTLDLPISYRGEEIGRVLMCAAGRARLSERDQRLLGDLVRQAAAAARASELSSTLQRIRERLVLTREEERRRLRRDLHDSLGPSLAAITLRIETARNLAHGDPAEADRMLEHATIEVAAVLADVRRLVHELRPPALDELGLLGAVRQQAERFRGDLHVTVTGAADMDGLPAAVEVAAYRIISEALANVSRHARATRCCVQLRAVAPSGVEIVVCDDGIGIGPDVAAGVGMLSLRERAAELGGHCSVTCPATGGTEVRARLPFGERTLA